MRTELSIHLRAFPVRVCDPNHGERDEVIVLDKTQLQAAQLVGQSSKELIHRICDRAGLLVLDIGRAEKRTVILDLDELYQAQDRIGRREENTRC